MVRRSIVAVLYAFSVIMFVTLQPQPTLAAVGCTPTTGAGYTITVCLDAPANNAVMTGTTTVTATATISAGAPSGVRISDVVFCLIEAPCTSGAAETAGYLLTDFRADAGGIYTFTLDSTLFADRTTTLHAYAEMSDGLVSQSSSATVTLQNGQTSPPPVPSGFQPTSGTAPGSGGMVVAAVGDGAGGLPQAQTVSDMVAGWNPNMFLYLGDVYEKGSPAEFQNWYAPSYGRFDSIGNPTVGNHEYSASPTAEGYFRYFKKPPDYYSYDAGGWHFVSLNSNSQFDSSVSGVRQTQPGSGGVRTMYDWLADDLTEHASACTIVYYHHPLWNQGEESQSTRMSAVWSLLAQRGVEMVLNGHDHSYQRYAPLDGAGNPSPTGVVEFIAGAGGHGTQQVTPGSMPGPNPVVSASAYSALKLTLRPDRADFVTEAPSGQQVDSGFVPCQAGGSDTSPPTRPVLAAPQVSSSAAGPSVALSWTAATDDRGVAGYRVLRNGAPVSGDLPASATTYTDTAVQPSTTYSYTVEAFDAAGNRTASDPPQSATTPAAGQVTVQAPGSQTADTYASASSPTAKGSATTMRVSAQTSPSGQNIGYLAFNVTGTSGIGRATLWLYSTSSFGTANRISAFAVPDPGWGESTLTWNQRPTIGATAGAAATPGGTAGVWKSWDVTDLVRGNGTVSFALQETAGSTAVTFATKEQSSAAFAPKLVIDPPTGPVADTTPPTVPTGLTATAGSATSVDLAWTAATDNSGSVASYTVYRAGQQVASVTTGTGYTDTTATAGSTYSYTVDAVDPAGNRSAASAAVSVTTPAAPDTTPPTVPTGLTATAGSPTSVDLAWTAATDASGVAGYRVQRGGSLISGTSPVTATSYTDSTAQPATQYAYTVTAVDTAGNESAASASGSVTTPGQQQQEATYSTALSQGVYVRSGSFAATNYWTSAIWRVGGTGQYATYLKVVVPANNPNVLANLTHVYLDLQPAVSSGGFEVHQGNSSTWEYKTITWNNQPGFAPTVLTTSGPATAGTPVRVDLAQWVTGPGTYTFVLTSPASTVQQYNSLSAASSRATVTVLSQP
jgi:fibronectin type 3 domain-containing protein